jgi:hypothetical protein
MTARSAKPSRPRRRGPGRSAPGKESSARSRGWLHRRSPVGLHRRLARVARSRACRRRGEPTGRAACSCIRPRSSCRTRTVRRSSRSRRAVPPRKRRSSTTERHWHCSARAPKGTDGTWGYTSKLYSRRARRQSVPDRDNGPVNCGGLDTPPGRGSHTAAGSNAISCRFISARPIAAGGRFTGRNTSAARCARACPRR